MEHQRSGLRELQIARGLVMLRWASIPILFGFAMLAIHFLRMSFHITPIYLLSCALALMNVLFTVHIAILSRQLMVRRGFSSLKRLLMQLVSRQTTRIREGGIAALFGLPSLALRVGTTFYLMLLEALKDVRFNLLSLQNIMHTQVITDIAMITLFIRFTGSAESPLLILSGIPVIIAGAVMGFYRGGIYAIGTGLAYLTVCLLVYLRVIPHIKFYGPEFGDLSGALGWIFSSFLMQIVALLGIAYLAHNLTGIFKERIFFLHQLLDSNRRESGAHGKIAENFSGSWFHLDPSGIVTRYRRGRITLLPQDVLGKNILEAIPAFKQYGMAFILQAVHSSGRGREIDRIKITSPKARFTPFPADSCP
jgi:hypothetical protein